ncbi:hypothetical protein FRB94_006295 [Tulasnella sp. JGI-2019a]|nr:hypothetical protein FRB94_006295 [Tulasnella sp. JGI-2019a]KAG9017423.1 hypothetical protein FRB93_007538 [Tulasnella sp. JGI-2019a]KAG9038551.1 hypothetical protein FRB95_000772 [Tulasnella sp. JGI-2019a]
MESTNPAIHPTTVAEYTSDVFQNLVLEYGTLSATVLLLWDWLTSLDDEVEFIWSLRSGISGRPLYLFLRYAGTAFEIYNAVAELGTQNQELYVNLTRVFARLNVTPIS